MQNFLDIGGLKKPSPEKKRCVIVKGKKKALKDTRNQTCSVETE